MSEKYVPELESIGKVRDKCIIDNIESSLNENFVGILFIGGAHTLEKSLNKNIDVVIHDCCTEYVPMFAKLEWR